MVDVVTDKINAKRKRGGPTIIKGDNRGGVINQYPERKQGYENPSKPNPVARKKK